MRKIFIVLSVIVLLSMIYLVLINYNNYLDLNYMIDSGTSVEDSAKILYISKAIKVSTYTLIAILSGIFVGAGTVYMFLSVQNEKVKAYQRELEKTSISGASNASKVDVLEAKIKTLEKAFNTVIDERKQLEVQIKSLNAELDNLNNK